MTQEEMKLTIRMFEVVALPLNMSELKKNRAKSFVKQMIMAAYYAGRRSADEVNFNDLLTEYIKSIE